MTGIDKSPNGFSEYSEYVIPEKRIHLLTVVLMFVLGEAFFPGVTQWLFNSVVDGFSDFISGSIDEILFLVGVVVVHEGIHALVAFSQGYRPKFGFNYAETFYFTKEPHPYVAVMEEHVTREDNIAMIVAPLLVIDAVALIGLLPVFPPLVAHYAKVALVVNTASSSTDIYNIVRLWTMEEGTKYINVIEDEIRTFYCKPLD